MFFIKTSLSSWCIVLPTPNMQLQRTNKRKFRFSEYVLWPPLNIRNVGHVRVLRKLGLDASGTAGVAWTQSDRKERSLHSPQLWHSSLTCSNLFSLNPCQPSTSHTSSTRLRPLINLFSHSLSFNPSFTLAHQLSIDSLSCLVLTVQGWERKQFVLFKPGHVASHEKKWDSNMAWEKVRL